MGDARSPTALGAWSRRSPSRGERSVRTVGTVPRLALLECCTTRSDASAVAAKAAAAFGKRLSHQAKRKTAS